MINWKTILSSFNDKPTLMQWLKIVEKALENGSLESVTATTTTDNAIEFTFKFADGSTISSNTAKLNLKGISGIEEVSDEIVGNQTLTTLRVHYTDGTTDECPVYAENGIPQYKHTLSVNVVNASGVTSSISVTAYLNYDKEFTLDTLKEYLKGKGQLFLYNRVNNSGIIYNIIAYNRNTDKVDILGYNLISFEVYNLSITAINIDGVVKL